MSTRTLRDEREKIQKNINRRIRSVVKTFGTSTPGGRDVYMDDKLRVSLESHNSMTMTVRLMEDEMPLVYGSGKVHTNPEPTLFTHRPGLWETYLTDLAKRADEAHPKTTPVEQIERRRSVPSEEDAFTSVNDSALFTELYQSAVVGPLIGWCETLLESGEKSESTKHPDLPYRRYEDDRVIITGHTNMIMSLNVWAIEPDSSKSRLVLMITQAENKDDIVSITPGPWIEHIRLAARELRPEKSDPNPGRAARRRLRHTFLRAHRSEHPGNSHVRRVGDNASYFLTIGSTAQRDRPHDPIRMLGIFGATIAALIAATLETPEDLIALGRVSDPVELSMKLVSLAATRLDMNIENAHRLTLTPGHLSELAESSAWSGRLTYEHAAKALDLYERAGEFSWDRVISVSLTDIARSVRKQIERESERAANMGPSIPELHHEAAAAIAEDAIDRIAEMPADYVLHSASVTGLNVSLTTTKPGDAAPSVITLEPRELDDTNLLQTMESVLSEIQNDPNTDPRRLERASRHMEEARARLRTLRERRRLRTLYIGNHDLQGYFFMVSVPSPDGPLIRWIEPHQPFCP